VKTQKPIFDAVTELVDSLESFLTVDLVEKWTVVMMLLQQLRPVHRFRWSGNSLRSLVNVRLVKRFRKVICLYNVVFGWKKTCFFCWVCWVGSNFCGGVRVWFDLSWIVFGLYYVVLLSNVCFWFWVIAIIGVWFLFGGK